MYKWIYIDNRGGKYSTCNLHSMNYVDNMDTLHPCFVVAVSVSPSKLYAYLLHLRLCPYPSILCKGRVTLFVKIPSFVWCKNLLPPMQSLF